MQKKYKVLSIFIVIIGLLGYLFYWAFFDMNRLPKGEFLTESISPEGTYTIRFYVVRGNATVSDSIRDELIFNTKNIKNKNIYWETKQEKVSIDWEDDNTVNINKQTLNLPNEKYDFRND